MNDCEKRHARTATITLGALVLFSTLMGCGGDVVAGEAIGGAGGTTQGSEPPVQDDCPGCRPVSSAPAGECAAEDELAQSAYVRWRTTPNDMAELAGSQWSGELGNAGFGVKLELTIQQDQTAYLHIGGPVPPLGEPDEGYLTGENPFDDGLLPPDTAGRLQPIHGAKLEGDQLVFALQWQAPWDEWCALQTPVLWDECRYEASENLASSYSLDGCTLGDETVDCGWFYLASYGLICDCSSEACWARAEWPNLDNTWETFEDFNLEVFELLYDAGAGTLTGHVSHEPVSLTRVD